MTSTNEPLAIAMFGISGAGKGTQSELLQTALKKRGERPVLRVEAGSLIREFMRGEGSLARRAKTLVSEGGLLPSVVPIYLLARELDAHFTGNEHIIIDGICRRPVQSEMTDEIIRFYGHHDRHAIVFDLSEDSARTRLRLRGRNDDLEDEAIARRMHWYTEQVVPSIDTLEKLGWQIHRLDAEPNIETIHTHVLQTLGL